MPQDAKSKDKLSKAERAAERERQDPDSPIISDATTEEVFDAVYRVGSEALTLAPEPFSSIGAMALRIGLQYAKEEDTSIP